MRNILVYSVLPMCFRAFLPGSVRFVALGLVCCCVKPLYRNVLSGMVLFSWWGFFVKPTEGDELNFE
jgi:hypothetical protein